MKEENHVFITSRIQINIEDRLKELSGSLEPVEKAIISLQRDLRSVLLEADKNSKDNGVSVNRKGEIGFLELRLKPDSENSGNKKNEFWKTESENMETYIESEGFFFYREDNKIILTAGDILGFVYGIYAFSREILGVHDFWFWNDQVFEKKEKIYIDEHMQMKSRPNKVKYRGWFVNDEVLLAQWSVDQNPVKPWEMVFEALLRCGGNMVIPGTDRNAHQYRALTSSMGLRITHHHAEPLGATMFARAYPHLNASYNEHPELFHKLWLDGIEQQKSMQVLWNLGFRGQGDCPFWSNDPAYDTDEARGALMGELIRKQYDMVKQEIPDAVCCSNLYGETMELYKKGVLDLPEDVIKIWADNGYGKMVSRRQGNHNPRVPSLPEETGAHGIYYHASFYDLQAANHITMLTNSFEFIQKELLKVFESGADDFWLINCSNVKPHVFSLAMIAAMWREKDIDLEQFRLDYIKMYYGENQAGEIAECFKEYADCALLYGELEDEHAAEQFTNHSTRILVTQWMKDRSKPARELLWACERDKLKDQVSWYKEKCQSAVINYNAFVSKCNRLSNHLELPASRRLFEDTIQLQGRIHALCYQGAVSFCEAFDLFEQEDYQRAFYHAGLAAEAYTAANQLLLQSEHGKWIGFYKNECLTDIKQTVWVLQGLMAWIRTLGDGPHFYQWQREFFYSEDDKRVRLILNMENHMTDQEIFQLMKRKWENDTL